jgi:putative chitinase
MLFTDTQLAQVMQSPTLRAQRWHPHLLAAASRFGISTRRRAAHWLAQIGHESLSLARIEEGLSYSKARLLEVFGERITSVQAPRFVQNPVALANYVYASRGGNGNESSGDGYLYRGRGPMQHTFRANYRHLGTLTGLPLEEQPGLLIELESSALAAAAYWQDNGLNALADAGDTLSIGRKINLGTIKTSRLPNGNGDRVSRTQRALQVLGAA